MRRVRDLATLDWSVSQLSEDDKVLLKLPAQVPGDLISDLVRNNNIKEPYFGRNSHKALWVDNFNWLYDAEFEADPASASRTFLVFDGVDYFAEFFLNGILLGSHEGMFGRILYDVTGKLEQTNKLEVKIQGIKDSWLEKLNPNRFELNESARVKVLKMQMSFGWDFAPKMKNYGIWDDVYLLETGPVFIHDIHVKPNADTGEVALQATIDARMPKNVKAQVKVSGSGIDENAPKTFEFPEAEMERGINRLQFDFKLEDFAQWNTWDFGEQRLYILELSMTVDGVVSDVISTTFGFRKIKFIRNEKSSEDDIPWTLVLNDKRLFMRGLNWVPPDSMLANATREKYEALLNLAKEANANILRVWGGGIREKKIFYDLCDRLGILVWQEFPLACAFRAKYSRSKRFLELIDKECSSIVMSLRNHPSVALLSGGNEIPIRRNKKVLSRIGDVVAELAPEIRYIHASPCKGESHNWIVWHGYGNHLDYLGDPAKIISEFGLQATPHVESLKKFIPEDELWPIGKTWYHHRAQVKKLKKYANVSLAGDKLEDFVKASQHAQAFYIKLAIEHLRRHKYERSGALVWQLNEPWPGISWSLVDYYLEPKPGYKAFKQAMSPLLAGVEYRIEQRSPGDEVETSLFIVNDFHKAFNGLEVELAFQGATLGRYSVDVEPDSVISFPAETIKLTDEKPWNLKAVMRHKSEVVSESDYDLGFYDGKRSPFLTRAFMIGTWKWVKKPLG